MAKNRKNSAGSGVQFGPAVKAFFICLVIGSLGVRTGELEKRLATLKRDNETRRQQLAMLHSLPYLDARVKELKLGLGVPTPDQILTLVEGQLTRVAPRNAPLPAVTSVAAPMEKTYFAYATKPLPPPSRKR